MAFYRLLFKAGITKNGKLFPTCKSQVTRIKLRVSAFCSRPFETSERIFAPNSRPFVARGEERQQISPILTVNDRPKNHFACRSSASFAELSTLVYSCRGAFETPEYPLAFSYFVILPKFGRFLYKKWPNFVPSQFRNTSSHNLADCCIL